MFKTYASSPGKTKKGQQIGCFVAVLLSASVKRFSVYPTRDFLNICANICTRPETQWPSVYRNIFISFVAGISMIIIQEVSLINYVALISSMVNWSF